MNNITRKYHTTVGEYHSKKLEEYAKKLKLPMSRLIALAIDNELSRKEPFKGLDMTLYKDVEEYAYSGQAQRIVDYMSKTKLPMTIDFLYSVRRDMGLTTLEDVVGGFSELMRAQLLVEVSPAFIKVPKGGNKYYKLWDGKDEEKAAKEYAKYIRLKDII